MRFTRTTGVLALAASASAFSDSSPFLLASTAKLSQSPELPQLQTSSQVIQHAREVLSSCPTDRYLVISQPGANAADLRGPDGTCGNSNLCRAATSDKIATRVSVAEVLGQVDGEGLKESIHTACARANKRDVKVDELKMAPLPRSERASRLVDNDHLLAPRLDELQEGTSYTIIYLAGATEPTYEATFADPLHAELKRQAVAEPMRRKENVTVDHRGLFEKYQFFSPGIFMGLVVTFLLLSILMVGLKALNSLEVSYGAFEKDMGPAAQKKQM